MNRTDRAHGSCAQFVRAIGPPTFEAAAFRHVSRSHAVAAKMLDADACEWQSIYAPA